MEIFLRVNELREFENVGSYLIFIKDNALKTVSVPRLVLIFHLLKKNDLATQAGGLMLRKDYFSRHYLAVLGLFYFRKRLVTKWTGAPAG